MLDVSLQYVGRQLSLGDQEKGLTPWNSLLLALLAVT